MALDREKNQIKSFGGIKIIMIIDKKIKKNFSRSKNKEALTLIVENKLSKPKEVKIKEKN